MADDSLDHGASPRLATRAPPLLTAKRTDRRNGSTCITPIRVRRIKPRPVVDGMYNSPVARAPSSPARPPMLASQLQTTIPQLGTICRLGLATRGNTHLDSESVMAAIERGVNYLNWCGADDALRACIRRLGPRRREVAIAVQLEARAAADARRELEHFLAEIETDYLDVVTYYYVEHADEWSEIIAPGGAAETIEQARADGRVRMIGLTTHQRPLAARLAAAQGLAGSSGAQSPRSGRLDLLMIRYNAAHRGAEREIFPMTAAMGMPVVAFTCTRWGALARPTPTDPAGFAVPRAPAWYRFVLAHPAVSVALMAPDNAEELAENLALLDNPQPLTPTDHELLQAHGDRVRRHAGQFP